VDSPGGAQLLPLHSRFRRRACAGAPAGYHPAAESLEWIARLRALVAERPEKFPKVVTTAEKSYWKTFSSETWALRAASPRHASHPSNAP